MKPRKFGLLSLIAIGTGSIIGSGWLFSAYYAAKYAGSGAYLAWILGAFLTLILTLILSEVVTLHPKRGLFTRLLTLSHNHDVGYITAIANWLGIVAVIPTEADATVQYLSAIKPEWTPYLFINDNLTTLGLGCAVILLIIYALINFWGVRLFAKSNNTITIFKVLIPVVTSIVIIIAAFHPGNFTAQQHEILPFGASSVFGAVMACGIVYAFNGFQSITSFCAEAKNPERNVPLSMIISIVLCLGIYLLLQTAFIGGLPPSMLKAGWHNLDFSSPIVQLTSLLGLNAMSVLLYVDACVSPSGTGIIYVGTTTRMLTAMAQEEQAPSFFNVLHPKYHFSRRSLIFNILLSCLLLFMFKSWASLVAIVSLFHILSYMACPLAMMRLRITEASRKRRYKLPFAAIICPLTFVLITFLYCFTAEKNLLTVTTAVVVFYGGYIIVHNRFKLSGILFSLKRSFIMVAYLIWLAFLGFLGNPIDGSINVITHEEFYALIIISSLIFYYIMVYRYPQDKAKKIRKKRYKK